MKNIEFEKSSIPGQFAINLRDEYGINWVESSTKNFYQTVFATMVDVLKFNQNKEKPRIGISIRTNSGNASVSTPFICPKCKLKVRDTN